MDFKSNSNYVSLRHRLNKSSFWRKLTILILPPFRATILNTKNEPSPIQPVWTYQQSEPTF
ncbi:hypothetical protein Scep_024623 [Stephania cephalantha]|uniref:Uncharacterized protein n=1 Tax=Stephania cephalantha TaxID=152367 RepID=A0AAP0F2B5_9MAGN